MKSISDIKWAEEKFHLLETKIGKELERIGNFIPYTPQEGRYTDVVEERGIDWWSNGFWGGLLWQLSHATGKEIYTQAAISQERRLDEALYRFRDIHHDVGFLWLLTSIAHYKVKGDEQAYHTGLHAATLLAGRFNISGDYLVAWNDKLPGWLIIDSMMNIPLLYWATDVTSDPRFGKIAKRHAATVAKYLVRDDGSVGHIASFNPDTGEFIEQIGGQGYHADSAWSRGNAWAIYGFALSYHHTKNSYYLMLAKKIANYFIDKVQETDYIPRVDFKAPKEPEIYDTSAGVCAACGMLEIAKWVPKEEKLFYEKIAVEILISIESKYANWNMNEDSIIGGGTEAYHRPSTYGIPLIYSDYFFTEGLLRILGKELFIW